MLLNQLIKKEKFTLQDLSESCDQETWEKLFPTAEIFREVIIEFLTAGTIDIPELQKEQTDYLMDASDGFVLNEMLLGLIENKRYRKIGKIYTFPMEDSEHVYFQNIIDESGNKRNFKCSNVGFRYEEREEMAYEAETIAYSQKIFYYLLCHGALSDLDAGANELYRAYVEHEEVMNLVKNQAEIADCRIERYGTCIYLMPDIDNKYLGFTKADLKKELCKSNATDRDYYLAQFVILTLMAEFYDGQGSTSKSREFLKLGELQNIISERLKAGLALEQEREQENTNIYSELYENVLDYKSMSDAYESLKSVETGSRSKYTKEGYVSIICNFLDRQGLIIFIPEDEMIKTTAKLDNIMEYKILNKENYTRIMEALGKAHE